jgi:hypothetical protein
MWGKLGRWGKWEHDCVVMSRQGVLRAPGNDPTGKRLGEWETILPSVGLRLPKVHIESGMPTGRPAGRQPARAAGGRAVAELQCSQHNARELLGGRSSMVGAIGWRTVSSVSGG